MAPAADDHEIAIHLDTLLQERGLSASELSELTGITEANLSKLKNVKVSAVRFATLTALCRVLDCQPGDILSYVPAKVTVSD